MFPRKPRTELKQTIALYKFFTLILLDYYRIILTCNKTGGACRARHSYPSVAPSVHISSDLVLFVLCLIFFVFYYFLIIFFFSSLHCVCISSLLPVFRCRPCTWIFAYSDCPFIDAVVSFFSDIHIIQIDRYIFFFNGALSKLRQTMQQYSIFGIDYDSAVMSKQSITFY